MSEQIVIEFDPQGNVKVAAQGVKGAGCQALTKAIEAAIGTTSSDQKTAEFFQMASCSASTSTTQQAKAGQ